LIIYIDRCILWCTHFLFFTMIWDIDLIFGTHVCECIVMSYRSSLNFVPIEWFWANLRTLDFLTLAKYLVVSTFFSLLFEILTWFLVQCMWVYSDELPIKIEFRSDWMILVLIYAPWTFNFGQIFSCRHFISLCFEILTWFLVFGITMMSYRSSLAFVSLNKSCEFKDAWGYRS